MSYPVVIRTYLLRVLVLTLLAKKNIHVLENFEEFNSILINDYGKIQIT